MALISVTRVLAADSLNDPILGGGEVSYTPPFEMSHSIRDDSVAYVHGNITAVVFHVIDLGMGQDAFFADTNAVSIEVMRRALGTEATRGFVGTNIIAKIIKMDGIEAVEIHGKKKGYSGVPDTWSDSIVMFWHKGASWSKTTALWIDISDFNEDDCQKLIGSVKSAKYHPPK